MSSNGHTIFRVFNTKEEAKEYVASLSESTHTIIDLSEVKKTKSKIGQTIASKWILAYSEHSRDRTKEPKQTSKLTTRVGLADDEEELLREATNEVPTGEDEEEEVEKITVGVRKTEQYDNGNAEYD